MALVSVNGIYAASDGQNLTSDSYTNTTPPDSNTPATTTQSLSSEDNPNDDYQNNDYQAAGEAPPSFTNEQIIQAALDVKKFLEGNKYLPDYITINGIQVNQATFLQLLTTTTTKINNSDTTTTTIINTKLPGTGTETTTPGTLTQTEYLTLAQNIQTFINTNNQAPATMNTVFGNIKFQSLIYLYTRALSMCQTYGTLPTYLAVRPWSNIPITDTNKNTITTQDITQTAKDVKNFLEYHKYLPEYITINGIVVNQATFLQLLTTTTTKINNQDNTPLTLQNIKQPPTGTETTTPGTLTQTEYLTLAQNIQTFINTNGQAPATMTSTLGNVKFESLLYMYCRILSNCKDNNGILPELVTVRPWSPSNIPIRDEFFTTPQIIKTAIDVKNFLEYNKYLPEYITVNGVVMNQSQFLYLIVTATLQLNTGDTTLITLINANKPGTPSETTTGGCILQNEYITLAETIKNYIKTNQKAPNGISTSLGQVSYQSLLYMYCRILNQNNLIHDLPVLINVKAWKTANIPIYDKASFTISEITQTAVDVKVFVDANGYMPEWITVGGVFLNQTQFLHLLTATTILINNHNTGSVNPVNAILPLNIVDDGLTDGTLSTDRYVLLAQEIKTYIEQNKKGPNSMTTDLGTTSFKSLIYMYSRILQQYKLHQTLPTTIILKEWNTSNIPIFDDHFTHPEIATTAMQVKLFAEGNLFLPTLITISGVVVNQAQFLHLLTTAALKISSNDNTATYLEKVNLPTYNYENMVSGNMALSDILIVAQRIKSYMDTNQKADGSISSNLGDISFTSQIYLFSRLMDYYNSHHSLPSSVTGIKPWALIVYNLPAGFEVYLYPSNNCNSNDPLIIDLAKRITVGAVTPYDKALSIFNWVRDLVEYEFYYNTAKGAYGTLNTMGGNCCDISHAIVALCRASGLAARYVHGNCFFTYSQVWYGHVWAQIYVNGGWAVADGSNNYNELGVINNWDTGSYTLKGIYSSLPF
ncbi:transglutaminase-like domain-containing protein [Methanobacterium formicicum]|uniref:Transglutaminase domain-containing protein n=1 Tax=Methanobacterium formicicum TaxID=2162 RepID=A0A843ASS6_METFO|nr:transglutaminase-like domain-containing protein [Methanobacterium formicicum]MBF4474613.1 transglutaminase domain-containing protein [Methanobacterium formicicum]